MKATVYPKLPIRSAVSSAVMGLPKVSLWERTASMSFAGGRSLNLSEPATVMATHQNGLPPGS